MNKGETWAMIKLLVDLEQWNYSDTSNVIRVAPKSHLHQLPADVPLENFGHPEEAGVYIRQRTELFRQSWIEPGFRALVEKYAKKHGIDLTKVRAARKRDLTATD